MKKVLFLFDFDGTITSEELLPQIAKQTDMFQEIEALTTATIKGIIPFESSFRLRCKLLQNVSIDKVHEIVKNIPRYRTIYNFIKENQKICYIITGNIDVWLKPIIDEFGAEHVYTSTIEPDTWRLTYILDKGRALKKIKEENPDYEIVSIGDGMGDVAMFRQSDISIAYGATHAPVESLIKTCNYIIRDENQLTKLLNRIKS